MLDPDLVGVWLRIAALVFAILFWIGTIYLLAAWLFS